MMSISRKDFGRSEEVQHIKNKWLEDELRGWRVASRRKAWWSTVETGLRINMNL